MKKKIKLEVIKVESFCTIVDSKREIVGGGPTQANQCKQDSTWILCSGGC